MNYICQDDRTLNLLRVWSGMKDVFTPTFFFWNAGNMLEKSTEGLLRSLLYQILQRFPSLIPFAYDNKSSLNHTPTGQQEFRPVAAWTERRLREILRSVMLQAYESCRICIFIDGLDEASDDPDAVIAVIRDLLSANAKICVSSRPDRSYSDAFDSYAKLRLQDLTEPDIRTYIWDELRPFLGTDSADSDRVSAILYNIARKAQGVFLWVKMVVRAVIKGLRSHDSLEQLRTRVESMPSDIEALYAQMLNNVEVAHRKEAALLFQMAIHGFTKSLLDVTFVLCHEIYHVPVVSGQSAVSFSLQTRERVPTVGAGLLEVILEHKDFVRHSGIGSSGIHESPIITLPLQTAYSSEIADLTYYERHVGIGFIHRTAIDFLCQSKQGQSFMEEYTTLCPSPRASYVRALLSKVDLLGLPKRPASIDASYIETGGVHVDIYAGDRLDKVIDHVAADLVFGIMKLMSKEEWETDAPQTSLCDDVDSTLTTLYHRHRVVLPHSHWVTRWDEALVFMPYAGALARSSRRSSRPSSSNSFQSARSELSTVPNTPLDFIGLAASWGLSRYVLEVLDLQQKSFDQPYIDYLLWCSTRVFRQLGPIPSMNLTVELLSRGGNPNVYIEGFSTTIWGAFLGVWAGLSTKISLVTTAQAFLNAGADIHMKIEISEKSYSRLKSAPEKSRGTLRVHLYSDASPLNLVRDLSKDIPEWKLVEEIILTKGGCDFHRYTHVKAYSEPGEQRYKIPESQHEKLVAALNEYNDPYANQPSSDSTRWRNLANICTEHLANIGDTDGQTSADDVVSSDADVEEDYYDVHDIRPVEDAQDSQPIE